MRQRGADVTEMTPAPFNVRSRVHEYGGGACLVASGVVYFSNFSDNRLYAIRDGAAPAPITQPGQHRFADFGFDAGRNRLLAVREDHSGGSAQPVNTLCAVGPDGSETVLVHGSDFYAAPRLSPDGRQLAWLCWDHPRMPWQGTELWVAEVLADGPGHAAAGRGRPAGSDLPARMVARWHTALRLRPQRLVEFVPPGRRYGPAAVRTGRRIRRAALVLWRRNVRLSLGT
jgi:hypothetical protein